MSKIQLLDYTILKPKAKPNMGLSGRYRMVVRDARTNDIVRETDWFDNLIVNAGLNRIGAALGSTTIGFCAIGTGTTAPANGDTSLAAQSASTTTTAPGNGGVSNSGSPNYITTNTYAYRFNAGTLNGNYTEVGVGWTSPNLFSRALILDGGGSPTTITVGPTEYLDVFYQVRMVPDLATYTTSVVIGGVTYSVQRKPAFVSTTGTWKFGNTGMALLVATSSGYGYPIQTYTGTMGAVTGQPSGTLTYCQTASVQDAYSNNSYERTASISIGLNDCNAAGGIKSMGIGTNYGAYQYEFASVIPKDSTKVMSISAKVTWARV